MLFLHHHQVTVTYLAYCFSGGSSQSRTGWGRPGRRNGTGRRLPWAQNSESIYLPSCGPVPRFVFVLYYSRLQLEVQNVSLLLTRIRKPLHESTTLQTRIGMLKFTPLCSGIKCVTLQRVCKAQLVV
jgi:hypothetical protein